MSEKLALALVAAAGAFLLVMKGEDKKKAPGFVPSPPNSEGGLVEDLKHSGQWRFGGGSLANVATLEPEMQRLAFRALDLSPVDFSVPNGRRTQAEQDELVRSGASRSRDSAHLSGYALDFAPYVKGEGVSYDEDLVQQVRAAFEQAAAELAIELKPIISWDRVHVEKLQRDPSLRVVYSAPGFRRAASSEVTADMQATAREVLFTPEVRQGEHLSERGVRYAVETHYSEARGNHRGVSIFLPV